MVIINIIIIIIIIITIINADRIKHKCIQILTMHIFFFKRECLTKYIIHFPEGGFKRNFQDSQRSHVYLPNETHPSICPLKTPFKNSHLLNSEAMMCQKCKLGILLLKSKSIYSRMSVPDASFQRRGRHNVPLSLKPCSTASFVCIQGNMLKARKQTRKHDAHQSYDDNAGHTHTQTQLD